MEGAAEEAGKVVRPEADRCVGNEHPDAFAGESESVDTGPVGADGVEQCASLVLLLSHPVAEDPEMAVLPGALPEDVGRGHQGGAEQGAPNGLKQTRQAGGDLRVAWIAGGLEDSRVPIERNDAEWDVDAEADLADHHQGVEGGRGLFPPHRTGGIDRDHERWIGLGMVLGPLPETIVVTGIGFALHRDAEVDALAGAVEAAAAMPESSGEESQENRGTVFDQLAVAGDGLLVGFGGAG